MSALQLNQQFRFCGTLNRMLRMFEFFGFSTPEAYQGRPTLKLFYFLYSTIFNIFTLYFVIIFQTLTVIKYRSDMNVVIEAATTLPGGWQIFIYVTILRVYRKEIKQVTQAYFDRVAVFDLKDSRIMDMVIATERLNHRIFVYLSSFCVIAVSLLMFVGDKSASEGLPMITWYPFDFKSSPLRYYSVFIWQMLELQYETFFNSTFEIFYLLFLLQFECELKLLQEKIKAIDCGKGEQEINHELNNVIRIQCHLIDGFEKLSEFMNWVACAQLGGGIVSICMVLYQFHISGHGDVLAIGSVFVMVSAISMKMFTISYVANNITLQSECIADALCTLDWWALSIRNKKQLILMIHATQKPINLNAIGLFPVNLNTFVTILKLAYSVFSLMIKLDAS